MQVLFRHDFITIVRKTWTAKLNPKNFKLWFLHRWGNTKIWHIGYISKVLNKYNYSDIQPAIYKKANISLKHLYLSKYNKNKIHRNSRLQYLKYSLKILSRHAGEMLKDRIDTEQVYLQALGWCLLSVPNLWFCLILQHWSAPCG